MPKSNTKPEPVAAVATVANTVESVIPCSLEEVESHLRAFVAAFVLPQVQPRWLEFLIDLRAEWDKKPWTPRSIKIGRKARDVMRMFAADEKYCTRLPNAKRTAADYDAMFGKSTGVYFELGTVPCKLTAVEADAKFSREDESAMLSFQAGKKALYFCHDGGIWKCEKE